MTYRFKIFPTDEQKEKIEVNLDNFRFIYNHFLKIQQKHISAGNKPYSLYGLFSMYVKFRKEQQYSFIKQSDSHAMQAAVAKVARDVETSRTFNYMKKSDLKKSYSMFNNNDTVRIKDNKIRLPKVGWVDILLTRKVFGRYKMITVSKNSRNHYWVNIVCEKQFVSFPETKKTVDISLGKEFFVELSDGNKFNNPSDVQTTLQKLKVEQKKLLRRRQRAIEDGRPLFNAKNYQKQRIVVDKLYERLSNQKIDFINKLTNFLLTNYDTINISYLSKEELQYNDRFAQGIYDASWYDFVKMLDYKCKNSNRILIIKNK